MSPFLKQKSLISSCFFGAQAFYDSGSFLMFVANIMEILNLNKETGIPSMQLEGSHSTTMIMVEIRDKDVRYDNSLLMQYCQNYDVDILKIAFFIGVIFPQTPMLWEASK